MSEPRTIEFVAALRASQRISAETSWERLVPAALSEMLAQAQTRRGLLVLVTKQEHSIEAEATAQNASVDVRFKRTPVVPTELAESVLSQALATREPCIIEDASLPGPFASDSYFTFGRVRSAICLPLILQGELRGAIYLDHPAPRAFSSDEVTLLSLLSTQTAISLEQSRLVQGLRSETAEHERAERLFSRAFHSSPAPMAITRISDSTFIDMNEHNLRMLEFKREEVIGKTAIELGILTLEERDRVVALRRQDRAMNDVEVCVHTRSGRAMTALVSSGLIEFGGEPCFLTVSYDITERKRMQDQLYQSQKMQAIGLLAGGIAHDFNNLLTAINGYGMQALESVESAHPLHRPILGILKASERAGALTRQLLTHSRREPREPGVFDVNGIVKDLEAMLVRIIGEDVRLVVTLAQDAGSARVDRGQLEQVVLNLVVNGRDAMTRGGELNIRTLKREHSGDAHPDLAPGTYVLLEVSDTGTGMSKHVKERIFEPFFTTKEEGKGTGLGLSTVYGIVKQCGGAVLLDSELGKGTTFSVYLPQVTPDRPSRATAIVPGAPPRGQETVLLVEDEAMVRKLCASVLESSGYTVIQATNGAEAVHVLEAAARPIHLIVTDVVMPDMGGHALVARARQITPGLPVLLISGYPEQARGSGPRDLRASDYLPKPFGPSDLTKKVRELLDWSETPSP